MSFVRRFARNRGAVVGAEGVLVGAGVLVF